MARGQSKSKVGARIHMTWKSIGLTQGRKGGSRSGGVREVRESGGRLKKVQIKSSLWSFFCVLIFKHQWKRKHTSDSLSCKRLGVETGDNTEWNGTTESCVFYGYYQWLTNLRWIQELDFKNLCMRHLKGAHCVSMTQHSSWHMLNAPSKNEWMK